MWHSTQSSIQQGLFVWPGMVYSSIGTVSLMPKTCTVFVSALLELTCPFPSSETLAAVPPAPVSPSGAGPDGHPAWCDAAHHAIDQSALTRGERGEGKRRKDSNSDTCNPPSMSHCTNALYVRTCTYVPPMNTHHQAHQHEHSFMQSEV